MVLSISKTRLSLFDFPHYQVWNFDNILEEVYAIDRHEKPIEYISLANNAYTGATLTRNCVGIWDLQNGRLQKMLANSAHRSVSNVTRIIAGSLSPNMKDEEDVFWDNQNLASMLKGVISYCYSNANIV